MGASIAILICIVEYWQLKFCVSGLKIILFYTCLGILMDSILSNFQVITYKNYITGIDWLIPIWGIALWLSFATWLQIAYYIKNYRLWISLSTLFIAPASYLAGVKLSVMELNYGYLSLLAIGTCWVLYINLVIYIQSIQNVNKPNVNKPNVNKPIS
jgi:hypothetical protein